MKVMDGKVVVCRVGKVCYRDQGRPRGGDR